VPAVPAPGREVAGVVVAGVVPVRVLVLFPCKVLSGFAGTCVAVRTFCPGAALTWVAAAGEALAWAVAARPCGAVERPGLAAGAGRTGADGPLAVVGRLAFVFGLDAPGTTCVFVTVAGDVAAGEGVERAAAGTTAVAGTAGTRSAGDAGRGSGSARRVGGAAAMWSADPNGTYFAGPTPSPPRTISESQTSASSATSRPTKRKQRRRRPLSSSKTRRGADPPAGAAMGA